MRTLFVLLDADGAVYNHKYRYLLDTLIDGFAEDIKRAQQGGAGDRQKLAATLKNVVEHCKLKHKNYAQLHDKIETNFKNYIQDEELLDVLKNHPQRLHHLIESQFIRWLQAIDPGILDNIVVKANERLLENVAQTVVDQGDVDSVVFVVASGRQSPMYDYLNSTRKGTRSFYLDMPVLENAFQKVMRGFDVVCHVSHDKFLMSDIFSNFTSGKSYKIALDHPGEPHLWPDTVYDHDKASLIYAITHHFARNYKRRTPPIMLYFEDTARIIEATMATGLACGGQLLPRNWQLKVIKYSGSHSMKSQTVIGTGKVDRNYRASIKKMIALCGGDPENVDELVLDVASKISWNDFLTWRDGMLEQDRVGSKRHHFHTPRLEREGSAIGGLRQNKLVKLF